MSPAAYELLAKAYANYKKSGSEHSSIIVSGDANKITLTKNAFKQLVESGYIENISEFRIGFTPVEFDICESGIEYMSLNGKF